MVMYSIFGSAAFVRCLADGSIQLFLLQWRPYCSIHVVLSVLSQLRFALNAFVAQTPRTTGSIKLQGSLEDMLIPLIHVYTSDFRLYPLLIMILPVLVSPQGRPTFLWESVRSIVCEGNVPHQADKMAFSLSGDIPNPDHTWALYLIAFRYQSLIAQPHNHILQETVALLLEILLAMGPDRTTDYECHHASILLKPMLGAINPSTHITGLLLDESMPTRIREYFVADGTTVMYWHKCGIESSDLPPEYSPSKYDPETLPEALYISGTAKSTRLHVQLLDGYHRAPLLSWSQTATSRRLLSLRIPASTQTSDMSIIRRPQDTQLVDIDLAPAASEPPGMQYPQSPFSFELLETNGHIPSQISEHNSLTEEIYPAYLDRTAQGLPQPILAVSFLVAVLLLPHVLSYSLFPVLVLMTPLFFIALIYRFFHNIDN
ncbi:hypothetical protein BJ165DRAFT_926841 [Panaeolus papilionaceus]|nr:hypothetical protein BJ165DRAFT_926841 [Panaeolus papilionaceus]